MSPYGIVESNWNKNLWIESSLQISVNGKTTVNSLIRGCYQDLFIFSVLVRDVKGLVFLIRKPLALYCGKWLLGLNFFVKVT
jgi:hypothetical protein